MLSDKSRILKNGFVPVPIEGKIPTLDDWSNANVTIKHANAWAASGVGIRCDGLCAIDIDVDRYAWFQEVVKILPPTAWVRRRSNSCKAIFLYSYDSEPLSGFRFVDDKGGSFGVDVLSDAMRQFAAFSRHPSGAMYLWDGPNPSTHSRKLLPKITANQVKQILQVSYDLLESKGIKLAEGAARSSSRVEDLSPDMEFEVTTPELGRMKWSDIRKLRLQSDGDMWCNLTAFRPGSDSKAGHILIDNGGEPYLYDFITNTAHFKKNEPLDTSVITKARGRPKKELEEPSMDKLPKKWREYVMVGGAWAVALSRPAVTSPARMKIDHFKRHIGAKNFNIWCEVALRADFEEFRVDLPPGVQPHPDYPGFDFLNTYKAKEFPKGSADLGPFYDYISSLVPDEDDREGLLDWMGMKLKNPHERMHGILFVSDKTQGTGRDTWNRLMSAMLGEDHTRSITFNRLTGGSGQSEFNGFMNNTLLVYTPEARCSSYSDGNARYEHLKTLVDPHAKVMEINEKGVNSRKLHVFTSIVIATNHIDAVHIPREDRRLIVIKTPYKLRAGHPIHEWMKDPVNLGVLREELMCRDFRQNRPDMTAPRLTNAKKQVVESFSTNLDLLMQDLEKASKSCIISEHIVIEYFKRRAKSHDYKNYNDLAKKVRAIVKSRYTRVRPVKGDDFGAVAKSTIRYICMDVMYRHGSASSETIREMASKNKSLLDTPELKLVANSE